MSKEIQAIRLAFNGGVHIGRGAEELDKTATTYSSDALKSALFAIGLPYYPEWADMRERFFESFRVSSAFPWCGEELFLPKPGSMRFRFDKNDDLTQAKQAKKIGFISSEIFRRWAANPNQEVHVKESQIGDGSFLFANSGKKFIHTAVQQRVQIPENGEGDTRPFYFERLLFSENSGLYFLISFQDQHLKPQLMHALQLLGDMGIGTDRTVGNGHFAIHSSTIIKLPSGTEGRQMALGLFLPSKAEIDSMNLDLSHWSLVKRGGYIAASEKDEYRSLRKNNIYFFGEGSTFTSSTLLKGIVTDLQPNWDTPGMHPVWRCGMPIFINL